MTPEFTHWPAVPHVTCDSDMALGKRRLKVCAQSVYNIVSLMSITARLNSAVLAATAQLLQHKKTAGAGLANAVQGSSTTMPLCGQKHQLSWLNKACLVCGVAPCQTPEVLMSSGSCPAM